MFFLHIPLNITATLYLWRLVSLVFSYKVAQERLQLSFAAGERAFSRIDIEPRPAIHRDQSHDPCRLSSAEQHHSSDQEEQTTASLPGQVAELCSPPNLPPNRRPNLQPNLPNAVAAVALPSRTVTVTYSAAPEFDSRRSLLSTAETKQYWFLAHSYLLGWGYAGALFVSIVVLELIGKSVFF